MHQYTIQQMSGHAGYKPCTFVGNYSEDLQLDECRVRDYIKQRAKGTLPSQKLQNKMSQHLSEVTLTPQHEDGFIHFGDIVCVQSAQTNGFLSIDLDDVLERMRFGVSTADSPAPVRRSAFIIERPPQKFGNKFDDECYKFTPEADYLHFGQPFQLRNAFVHPDTDLYVQSMQIAPHTGRVSKVSKKQEVSAVPVNTTFDCCWQILSADVRQRAASHATPVPGNKVVTLHHCQTNQLLASDKKIIQNSFGQEYEVCCHRFVAQQTKHSNQEVEDCNLWALVTAPTGGHLQEYHEAAYRDSTTIVDRVKAKLLARAGKGGFRMMVRIMKTMDRDGNNMLSLEELMNGLQTYNIYLSEEEARAVMRAMDRDRSGTVSITEFVRSLRGQMSRRRTDIVQEAFQRLDKDKSGHVTMDDLKKIYGKNINRHPDVANGSKTPEKVLLEFTADWDKNGDAVITLDEFIDYYTDLSVSIDDDNYFELMVRNAWHISGGQGVCENTTCRRVLVIHTDNRQTVEEIKDDLGIGPNDLDAMRAALEQQGITDIKEIKIKG